jgi:hypothetical protein
MADIQPVEVKDVAVRGVPDAPSAEVSSKRQSLSDVFTIVRIISATRDHLLTFSQFAAGAALVSDGYFNNVMTLINVLLKKEYPTQYTATVSTRVSNSLLVGEIFGTYFIQIGSLCSETPSYPRNPYSRNPSSLMALACLNVLRVGKTLFR